MKLETQNLILTPLGKLILESCTTDSGKVSHDLVWQIQTSTANHVITSAPSPAAARS